jgi:hypothetical protein
MRTTMSKWSWLAWIGVLAGLYLIASPFLYGVTGMTVTWVSIITGIVVIIVALTAFFGIMGTGSQAWSWVSWGLVILGIWTIVVPFIFGIVAGPMINWIITGIVILIVGVVHWLLTYGGMRRTTV